MLGSWRSSVRRRLVPSVRCLSSGDRKWDAEWQGKVDGIKGKVGSYEESAEQLRDIVRSGVVRFTDLRDHPERFFLAHRMLAHRSPTLGPGFWIRFTVCYNLFAGTILAVGSPEQVKQLDEIQAAGQLGCFALTERFAGVNSGLVVNTKAKYDIKSKEFILSSPGPGANKNWISQGFVGDKTVVVADLEVGGKSVGPHAFVMDLRRNGKVVPGVSLEDMGPKTVGNDLDNARIHFESVRLPRAALLNRYAEVSEDGVYSQTSKLHPMQMIGQRLFSGRVAVAQAALEFRRGLFEITKKYSDNKKCWSPKGDISLSSIPHLAALYVENDVKAAGTERFVRICEKKLSESLTKDELPSTELTDAIAVAKIVAVEESIEYCFRLKQEVGSFALMGGSGFDQFDFLQCCKFAEGDSRILKMKLARDQLRVFEKKGPSGVKVLDELCARIGKGIAEHLKANPGDKQAAADSQWRLMFELADARIAHVVSHFS